MTKQNSWLLTKKEAEEILQNILDEITFAANKRTPRLYSLI